MIHLKEFQYQPGKCSKINYFAEYCSIQATRNTFQLIQVELDILVNIAT